MAKITIVFENEKHTTTKTFYYVIDKSNKEDSSHHRPSPVELGEALKPYTIRDG